MRYVCIMEIVNGKPVRLLGTDAVVKCDGRLTNYNANREYLAYFDSLSKFKGVENYIVVLFRATSLSGEWSYLGHVPVTGSATIPDILDALN